MSGQTNNPKQAVSVSQQCKNEWHKWQRLSLYERFEYVIILLLTLAMAIVIVMTMWDLGATLIRDISTPGGLNSADTVVFQKFFGVVMTVIIALEFKRSMLVSTERNAGFIQARAVVMIGLLAIVRKIILLDPSDFEATKLFSLGAASLALGIVYWLVRDQDRRDTPTDNQRSS